MKRLVLPLALVLLAGCASPDAPPTITTPEEPPSLPTAPELPRAPRCEAYGPFPCESWDFEANGTPQFSTSLHLDANLIGKISRFRSGYGHDYSRGTSESCRSMKHYFVPEPPSLDATLLEIRSPVTGFVVRLQDEQSIGTQVWLAPEGRDAFRVILFHVTLDANVVTGTRVEAGERLGHHASNRTADDVAVLALTREDQRLVSFFDTMNDEAFAPFAERGLARADFVIDAAWRDAHPMTCSGEAFTGGDRTRDWVVLNSSDSSAS